VVITAVKKGTNCVACDVQLMEKERFISSLRRRTDSESSAGQLHTDVASDGLEQRVLDFNERAPLIESLQRELSSAQVVQLYLLSFLGAIIGL